MTGGGDGRDGLSPSRRAHRQVAIDDRPHLVERGVIRAAVRVPRRVDGREPRVLGQDLRPVVAVDVAAIDVERSASARCRGKRPGRQVEERVARPPSACGEWLVG